MEPNIKDIITRAEDLSKKISNLQNEKTLPTIELDIILLDIRTLYEEIKILQNKSSWDISPEKVPVPEVSPKIPPIEQSPAEPPQVEPAPIEQSPAEPPQVETPKVETPPIETSTVEPSPIEASTTAESAIASSSVQTPPVEKPPVENPPVEIPQNKISKPGAPEKPSGPTTLADRYKGEKKFINESLAGNFNKNDISSQIQSKPIQNIGSALGINDRFKLINDLFNGDKESFQNTINVLDASSNFNEAFNYINSSFDWDMENESVQLLLDLVRRKFIVNQNE